MQESKQQNPLYSHFKMSSVISYISKIGSQDKKTRLMFCTGKCEEASDLGELCPACVAEYFDYVQAKGEDR